MEASWTPWVVLGLTGQLVFASRMMLQWIASERRGESIVPETFWWLSLLGGVLLLLYAIHRADPVFMLGQSTGVVVYARNLILLRRRAAAIP